MAQEILVKEVLSQEIVEAGAGLLKALEGREWSIVAAFWLYNPERNDWALVIASPVVAEKGSYPASLEALRTLRTLDSPLLFDDVRIVAPSDPTVRALRAHAARFDLAGRRIRGSVEREWIEDSYVYRVVPEPAE